jgi:hypothetical protein
MNPASDPGHGHSPAAWAAVVVMIFALSVGTVAFFLQVWWLVLASGALTLAGWGLGFLRAAMGWGVRGPKYQPKDHA